MSFLKNLGLSPKKPEAAPSIGSNKRREEERKQLRNAKYVRALILFSFLALVLIVLPRPSYQPVASYTIGEPWRSDDLTSPFTFSIKKTAEELEEERNELSMQIEPIFHIDLDAEAVIISRLDSLLRDLQPVLDSYIQWQRAANNDSPSAETDSLRFIEEQMYLEWELNSSAWDAILDLHANVTFNNQPQQRLPVNQMRMQLELIIEDVLSDGIIDLHKSEIEQDDITIRNLRESTQRSVSLSNVHDLTESFEFARLRLHRNTTSEMADASLQIFAHVIEPNLIYSASNTEMLYQESLLNISLTKGAVDQGQIIIRRGDIVTEEIDNVLQSLAEARALTATTLERGLRFAGESIVIIIAILMFFFYIFLYRKKIHDSPLLFFLVFLVLSIVALPSALIYPFESVSSYIIPIAIAPIILTIIFDSRVGLMATIALAIITGVIHDYNFEYMVSTISACSLGVFSVRDIKKRSQFFFVTPGVVFVTYVAVIAGFGLARFTGWEQFLNDLFFIAVNSIFILFTYPLMLLFEKLFKITTDFTLIELADTNLPLMKELMNKAPGTFHHSLQVANLAESAASDIGANALLCRVGAMYHDIGKMVKPSYFIENQNKENEHDKLKPRMSALVIKAHVSEGVKIANQYNLPDVIIDFIRTHHGTSLIRYFYSKAMEASGEEEIADEDFRYEGPIPFTPEQGILMLADGVEASCRSMKNTSYSKLENRVNRIIDDHISDGQLSNCPLTFRQIQIIKESFLRILKGVYHTRIEYPDAEESLPEKSDPVNPAGIGIPEESEPDPQENRVDG